MKYYRQQTTINYSRKGIRENNSQEIIETTRHQSKNHPINTRHCSNIPRGAGCETPLRIAA
jgi:hypothetical protein